MVLAPACSLGISAPELFSRGLTRALQPVQPPPLAAQPLLCSILEAVAVASPDSTQCLPTALQSCHLLHHVLSATASSQAPQLLSAGNFHSSPHKERGPLRVYRSNSHPQLYTTFSWKDFKISMPSPSLTWLVETKSLHWSPGSGFLKTYKWFWQEWVLRAIRGMGEHPSSPCHVLPVRDITKTGARAPCQSGSRNARFNLSLSLPICVVIASTPLGKCNICILYFHITL